MWAPILANTFDISADTPPCSTLNTIEAMWMLRNLVVHNSNCLNLMSTIQGLRIRLKEHLDALTVVDNVNCEVSRIIFLGPSD